MIDRGMVEEADDAGLESGDVIIDNNGVEIKNVSNLPRVLLLMNLR